MEKLLICDICGTSYADTDEKCPTCGYARAFDVETFYSERPSVPHTKVRGGRYSKKNVKKRLQGLAEQTVQTQEEVHEPIEQMEVEIPADVTAIGSSAFSSSKRTSSASRRLCSVLTLPSNSWTSGAT